MSARTVRERRVYEKEIETLKHRCVARLVELSRCAAVV
jgi:hypothetical protein